MDSSTPTPPVGTHSAAPRRSVERDRNLVARCRSAGRGSQVYDCDFKYAAYPAPGVRDVWRVDLRDRRVVVKTGPGAENMYEERFDGHPAEIEYALTVDVLSIIDDVQGGQLIIR